MSELTPERLAELDRVAETAILANNFDPDGLALPAALDDFDHHFTPDVVRALLRSLQEAREERQQIRSHLGTLIGRNGYMFRVLEAVDPEKAQALRVHLRKEEIDAADLLRQKEVLQASLQQAQEALRTEGALQRKYEAIYQAANAKFREIEGVLDVEVDFEFVVTVKIGEFSDQSLRNRIYDVQAGLANDLRTPIDFNVIESAALSEKETQ